jgi:hypothetical protein
MLLFRLILMAYVLSIGANMAGDIFRVIIVLCLAAVLYGLIYSAPVLASIALIFLIILLLSTLE